MAAILNASEQFASKAMFESATEKFRISKSLPLEDFVCTVFPSFTTRIFNSFGENFKLHSLNFQLYSLNIKLHF